MSSKTTSKLILSLTAALVSAMFTGCTVVGALVGFAQDDRQSQLLHAGCMNMDVIPTGCKAIVTCTNGDVFDGTYLGVTPLNAAIYAANYSAARTALDSIVELPALGDTLIIIRPSGKRYDYEFNGFGPQALLENGGGASAARRLPLAGIDQLQARKGHSYDMESIRALMNAHRLPLDAGIVLQSDEMTRQIPLNDIKVINAKPERTYSWLVDACLGCCVDAVIVGLILR